MTQLQPRQQLRLVRRIRFAIGALLLSVISTAFLGCKQSYPMGDRPKVGPMPQTKRDALNSNLAQAQQRLFKRSMRGGELELSALSANQRQQLFDQRSQALKAVAPGGVISSDPPVCLPQGVTDPADSPLGNHTTIAPYTWSSPLNITNMYASLYIEEDICTSQTLSSSDESRLMAVLNAFGITKAQSFTANLTVTGDAFGGVQYPQIVPFSYSYNQKAKTYQVTTSSLTQTPWQPTTAFEIGWSYNNSTTVSIATADLFTSIVTDVAGAGGSSSLLSPAANAYLSAGNAVAQQLATALSNSNNESDKAHHFDLKQGPYSPARSVTYRFRDQKNQPLAGVRVTVAFTNSLFTLDPIQPDTSDSTHVPHFDDGAAPPIVNVTVAGPSGGSQTLLQQISKDQAYRSLISSTSSTDPTSFAKACTDFENDLQTIYGLNKYDVALTEAYVLSQNTPYLQLNKLYSSGCFVNGIGGRKLMDSMGITIFDKAPAS